MADKFLNLTAVQAIKTWATGLFSTKTELQTLDDKVDDIISEGGEPNTIESISVNGTAVAPDAQKNVNLMVQEFNVITYDVTTYSELQTMYQNKKPTFIRLGSSDYLPVHSIDINEQDALFIIHIPVITSADGSMLTTIIVVVNSNNRWSMTPFIKSIPTKVSDLTNDGDGTQGSAFATEDYVEQNGGKIDSISVNGTAQTIDANKNVDLTVQQFNIIEYGVTPHADIAAMLSKPLLLKHSNYFLPISGLSTDTNGSYIIYCNGMLRPDSTTTLMYQTATVDVNDRWTESSVVNVFPTVVSDLTNDSGYQTASDVQSAIASSVASVVKLKGSVANYASLPATGNTHGDLWNTLDTGKNYVWLVEDGTGAWDDYAGTMDLSAYWTSTSGQTNTLEAATVTEINAILNA